MQSPPMPRDWLYVQLARTFGGWPGDYKRRPADDLEYWVGLLNMEAHVQADREGMPSDEEMTCYEFDDEDALNDAG